MQKFAKQVEDVCTMQVKDVKQTMGTTIRRVVQQMFAQNSLMGASSEGGVNLGVINSALQQKASVD
jgi:hypothetical protein